MWWNLTCLFFPVLTCRLLLLPVLGCFPTSCQLLKPTRAGPRAVSGAPSDQCGSTAGRLTRPRSESRAGGRHRLPPSSPFLYSSCPRAVLGFQSPHLKALKTFWNEVTAKRSRLFRESTLRWSPHLIIQNFPFRLFWGRLPHRVQVCVLENVRAARLLEHRNWGYTSLQELTGFFTPGVLGPGLEEVGEVREIRGKFVCVNDFFFPRGEGC